MGAVFTALSLATQNGHVSAVEYLLSQAADASISDELCEICARRRCTTRRGAATRPDVALLIEHGAPLEALNLGDCTRRRPAT